MCILTFKRVKCVHKDKYCEMTNVPLLDDYMDLDFCLKGVHFMFAWIVIQTHVGDMVLLDFLVLSLEGAKGLNYGFLPCFLQDFGLHISSLKQPQS